MEITESSLSARLGVALTRLTRLRLRGFGLSIDDYGTGFSSMQQLARIPFTELKIDRSFVCGAQQRPHLQVILRSALEMCRQLGLVSVAEGIETLEDWRLLQRPGLRCGPGLADRPPHARRGDAPGCASTASGCPHCAPLTPAARTAHPVFAPERPCTPERSRLPALPALHPRRGRHLAVVGQEVTGRRPAGQRLAARELDSFHDYLALLERREEHAEAQIAVDLLTTNETYFFREPKHFELLRRVAQAAPSHQPFRIWSAASSTGEEAYSMAMVLADVRGEHPYEVVGTDISTRVLARARQGHYPMERIRQMPGDYLRRFCLKGTGRRRHAADPRPLRQKVNFLHLNLNERLPNLGSFDMVFLRNVLIYFNPETKRQVVHRVLETLPRGGWFCIGHSENLNDVGAPVDQVAPSIYRKV
jgi:chemotaxis protein methyltransferase CheR